MLPRMRTPSLSLVTDVALQTAPLAVRAISTTTSGDDQLEARFKFTKWRFSPDAEKVKGEGGSGPRYLGPLPDQPFPLNPLFRSQPVLDEQMRELIWKKVMERGESLKAVSAEMSVDVRRVAAVVRLKEVEKNWQREGKRLAIPYAKAIMSMLPKTSYREGQRNVPHEAVNEVQVHKLTMQQLFVPVSESRHFTREDAAKAFHDTMLSVDSRSPQPQLIDMERDILEGKSREESIAKFKEATRREEEAVAQRILRQQEKEEKLTTRVRTDRCEFRFQEISVNDAGRDGRARKATGWRYGAPLDDRKRGAIKIPTSVP